MKINILGLLRDPGAKESFSFKLDDIPTVYDDNGIKILDLPEVDGTLVNMGNHLALTATIKTRIEGACDRCLSKVVSPIEIEFEDLFVFTKEDDAEEDFTASELNEFYHLTEEWLDLTQCVNEQLLISVPMQILCQQDCPGLCPGCGADLKLGPCDCSQKEIDPRFAVLARLKE